MYFPAGPASVTLQSLSSDTCSEDDEYFEVCVEINDLPAGGLGCDVMVTVSVNDGSAGNLFMIQHPMYKHNIFFNFSFPRRFHVCITSCTNIWCY